MVLRPFSVQRRPLSFLWILKDGEGGEDDSQALEASPLSWRSQEEGWFGKARCGEVGMWLFAFFLPFHMFADLCWHEEHRGISQHGLWTFKLKILSEMVSH